MNTVRRIRRAAFLSLVFVLLLAACSAGGSGSGSGSGTGTGVSGGGTKQDRYVIGFSMENASLVVNAYIIDTVRVHAEAKGNIDLIVLDGQGKLEKQVADIEDLITQKVDALIVKPMNTDSLTNVISKAYQAGIPVILQDRGINGEDYTARVTYDNVQIGQIMFEWMAQDLGGKGNVVIIEGLPGASSNEELKEGFKIANEKYSDIKVLAIQPANYRADEALRVMENYLQQFPNQIDALIAWSDVATLGAVQAIEQTGNSGKIKVYSQLGSTEALRAIRDGKMEMTVKIPMGEDEVIDVALKAIQGEPLDKLIYTEPIVIDRSTLDLWDLESDSFMALRKQ